MIKAAFLVPGSLDTRTGGYRYDKRIIEELRSLGHVVEVHPLAGSFPFPSTADTAHADAVLEQLDDHHVVVIDGLACAVLSDVLARHAHRLQLIALVHHPLALETGLTPDVAARLRQQETDALVHVSRVITTSPSTTASLADYHVSDERIVTVEPGTDRGPLSDDQRGDVAQLLCVATITERKGHGVLIAALQRLQQRCPDLRWEAHCVGSIERDANHWRSLQQQLEATDIAGKLTFHGEADDAALEQHYLNADLFVLPSFHEGFGMVLTEAIAHGLPIISTTAGAIPDTVPDGTGVLVPPDDTAALADALEHVLTDATTLETLTQAARKERLQLSSWRDAAVQFAEACSGTRTS